MAKARKVVRNKDNFEAVVTRFPNAEVGALAGLLIILDVLRRALGLVEGFKWEFVPAGSLNFSEKYKGKTPAQMKAAGKLLFNTGGGEADGERADYDQHGQPENANGSRICSLDLVLRKYDFLKEFPNMEPIYRLIAKNDIAGVAVSKSKRNIRRAMVAMTVLHRDDPETVLKFVGLGFCGAFALAQSGTVLPDPLSEDSVLEGVKFYAPQEYDEFKGTMDGSLNFLEEEFKRAQVELRTNRQLCFGHGRFHNYITHPEVTKLAGRDLQIAAVESDNIMMGAAARNAGIDVLFKKRKSSGHMSAICRTIVAKDKTRHRMSLVPSVIAARREEARHRGINLPAKLNLGKTGYIMNAKIPVYLAEFLTLVACGTDGNLKVPAPKMPFSRFVKVICDSLPQCPLFEREEDNEK